MTQQEYVQACCRTEALPAGTDMQDRINQVLHHLSGLFLEITEVASRIDVLKKFIFYRKPLPIDYPDAAPYRDELPFLTAQDVRVLHASIGMLTEVGEILEVVGDKLFCEAADNHIHLAEELGDLFWYCAIMCSALDLDMELVMERNIAKLKARYPDKFTEQDALNRNLELEKDALKGNR